MPLLIVRRFSNRECHLRSRVLVVLEGSELWEGVGEDAIASIQADATHLDFKLRCYKRINGLMEGYWESGSVGKCDGEEKTLDCLCIVPENYNECTYP